MSDGTKLVSLVRRVRNVSSVRADGAYAWRTNAQFIEDIGSVPYLKPRKDAIGGSRGYPAWRSLMLRYNSDREVWLEEYRKRWIMECILIGEEEARPILVRQEGVHTEEGTHHEVHSA